MWRSSYFLLCFLLGAVLPGRPAFAAPDSLSIRWELSGQDNDQEVKEILEASEVLSRLEGFVSGSIILQEPAAIVFYQGRDKYFDRRQHASFIPLTKLRQIYSSVQSRYATEAVQKQIFLSAVEQMLWSELGRILISQFALPIQGEEAYALDSFATLMLLNIYDNKYLLDAAEEYLVVDDASHLVQEGRFQTEIEFDRSRYQLILCMVLGKDYVPYSDTLKSLAWEQERLQQCEGRYRAQVDSWYQALVAHLQPTSRIRRWLAPVQSVE